MTTPTDPWLAELFREQHRKQDNRLRIRLSLLRSQQRFGPTPTRATAPTAGAVSRGLPANAVSRAVRLDHPQIDRVLIHNGLSPAERTAVLDKLAVGGTAVTLPRGTGEVFLNLDGTICIRRRSRRTLRSEIR